MHIVYRLAIDKPYAVYAAHKPVVNARKKLIQKLLSKEMGLLLEFVREGSDTIAVLMKRQHTYSSPTHR